MTELTRDPDAEDREPTRCNHHPDVAGDCEADNAAISWERDW